MIPFLKSIAKAYAGRYADLSEICFLFPNKRGGTFFLKYLKEEYASHAMISPAVMTISDFVAEVAQRVPASRLDLLFILFSCYRKLQGLPEVKDEKNGVSLFDDFISWGETVLNDFNEVDQYLVNPEEIFKNVKDYREITSNFLTEEQRKVMAEYFGRTDIGDPGRFWKNFENDNLSEAKNRFLYLWRIMMPLYRLFNEQLAGESLAYTGALYRIALDRLRKEGVRNVLCDYKKVVAVGFNALNTSEHLIFKLLKDEEGYDGFDSFADFFWDATGPILGKGRNTASTFVRADIETFPCPPWAIPSLRLSDKATLPGEIRIVSSPSNSAQAKIAGVALKELYDRLDGSEFRDAKVAVVLPDENLLLPMLYSLPEEIHDVNLTMGYPLKLTSAVSFVSLLRRTVGSIRNVRSERAFFGRDLRLFLSHPYCQACFTASSIRNVNELIISKHRVTVTEGELREEAPEIYEILHGYDRKSTPTEALKWLEKVLSDVRSRLSSGKNAFLKTRLETGHIDSYLDSLRRLSDIMNERGVPMRPTTVFRLSERLIGGEMVNFEGEPLVGLQVMGMLETRSLDFEHIIILSANERTLPRRARTRSFIADSLRHAYGMPPSNYAEEIFGYYFYRMISRAKGVTLVYDARTGGGLRSGDVSRYILQLRHLFAQDQLIEEDWKFMLSGREAVDPSVSKDEDIMERLSLFTVAGKEGRNFSASALQGYRECQVRFFYETVLRINTDPEPTEFIDAITAGNILHDVMRRVYTGDNDEKGRILDSPLRITESLIDSILENQGEIRRLVRQSINRNHYHTGDDGIDSPLSSGSEMVADRIVEQVMRVLAYDRSLTPFNLLGCEIEDVVRIKLPSGRIVNFRFAIDRLDEIRSSVTGRWQLRIVDYKTGSIKLNASTFDDVLKGDWRGEQVFQLFIYAWLLGKLPGFEGKTDIRMEIYNVPAIFKGEKYLPKIGSLDEEGALSGKQDEVESFEAYADQFSERIEEMLDSIFEAPRFEAASEEECGSCPFRGVCRR